MKKTLMLLTASLVLCGAEAYADMNTYTIDPAPGAVQEISSVKITFDVGFAVASTNATKLASVTLTNKDNPSQKYIVAEATADWFGAVTLKFGTTVGSAETITADGTWNLVIPAGLLKNAENQETDTNPLIDVDFIIGGEPENDMTRYTLDPSSGTVDKITSIKVSFPETSFWGIDDPKDVSGVTLTKTGYSGKVYNAVKYDYVGLDYATLYFDLSDAEVKEAMDIVEAGTYELNIPAGTFTKYFSTETNANIKATYTIESVGGDYMAYCNVTPAAGHVDKLSTVTLRFGTISQAYMVNDADFSTIKITKKGANTDRGETPEVYSCVSARSADGNNAFTLSFAPEGESEATDILKAGEYLLYIPAGLFYYPLNMVDWKNDAMSILYTIDAPTTTTSLEAYTLDPADGESIESLANVTLTFPDCTQGLQYPFDNLSNIKLNVKKSDGSEEESGTVGCSYDQDKTVTLSFAQLYEPLTEPGEYTVTIPTGTFYEAGNPNATNTDITATYTISQSKVLAESISLDIAEKMIVEGQQFKLTATVLPENTTDKTVLWSSTDTDVATVDQEGNVTVLTTGTCRIVATTADGSNLEASCKLTAVTSGVESVLTDENGRYDVYGLNGVLVKGNATADEVRALPAGVYIVGGKKVIVK